MLKQGGDHAASPDELRKSPRRASARRAAARVSSRARKFIGEPSSKRDDLLQTAPGDAGA